MSIVNEESAGTAVAAAPIVIAPGFGERLRVAREAAGQTQSQVADRLHCDARVIAALESEDLPALGAAVYARGHLRRYADHLKLPSAELVAQYDQRQDHPGSQPDLTRIPKAERPRDPNKVLRWVYAIPAGLLGLFIIWFVLQSPRGKGNLTDVLTTVPLPAAATAQPPATPAAVASAAPAAVQPTRAGEAAVTAAPMPVSGNAAAPPAAASSTASNATAATPDSTVKLGLRPSADCWTEVYDVEGRQLFFDIAKRGARQDVAGKGPLRLVLGNAAVMKLELSGRELAVPADLQRKGTAFINVAADGHMEPSR